MTPRWRAVVLEVPQGLGDEVAAALADHALGAHLEEGRAGKTRVRVFLDEGADSDRWRERAGAILSAHGIAGIKTRVEEVEDGRWEERWREGLGPLPLGERFVVLPRDGLVPPPGRRALRLSPGMAFGTGEHPTTRLCAAALEGAVRAGDRWLDVGTGTGILALVARLSGAAAVVALDTDPEAVRVAEETVAANGERTAIESRRGTVAEEAARGYDGAVANIAASFFLREGRPLAGALRPGGTLVASGFLEDDVPDVEGALSRAGFGGFVRAIEGAWAGLVARLGTS